MLQRGLIFFFSFFGLNMNIFRGDLGGGGVASASTPQGFDSLSTQRVRNLYFFEISSIFGDGPQKFF